MRRIYGLLGRYVIDRTGCQRASHQGARNRKANVSLTRRRLRRTMRLALPE
jgi:hypothetical protein